MGCLETLNLSSNRLSSIDMSILDSLSSLLHLDISFNQFVDFPYYEGQLPSLRYLDLRGNPLCSIPRFILRSSLQSLAVDWIVGIDAAGCRSETDIVKVVKNCRGSIEIREIEEIFEK